jgi:malate permease and related proteins
MEAAIRVIETVLAFTAVVGVGLLFRQWGILREQDSGLFARLLTQAILPAVVFNQLVTRPIHGHQLWLVMIVIAAGVLSIGMAWILGHALRLDRPRIGALILTSSFGSSALLGYPVIQYAFPGDTAALTDAVLISELGVGLPIFTLGPAIALYFGAAGSDAPRGKAMWAQYFRSPVFVAVVFGLVLAPLHLDPQQPFLAPLFEALRMMEGALAVLACFTLALQLKVQSLRGLWLLLLVSALIQMAFQPAAAKAMADLLQISGVERQVLILITAMPAAVLGPVFATRYNCDGVTASNLVMSHILMSLVLIPLTFFTLDLH